MVKLTLTWVILDKALVEVGELVRGDVAAGVVWGLEVQVVFSSLEELGGGDVHADNNLVSVASLGDGILQQFQSCGNVNDWLFQTDK